MSSILYCLSNSVISSGFEYDPADDNIEIRRKQLLDYLDEMNICWKENNIDMTDRQYIKIINKNYKHY